MELRRATRPAARPTPTSKPTPVPVWARRWDKAITSIDDYTRRVPSARFPRNAIMLTIDDGPSPLWTPRYLALLAHHHVRAAFFMIGAQVRQYPELAREVARQGHVIGNHTWTHDEQLTTRPVERIRSEIGRTTHAITHATGIVPTQFRAPGGAWGPRLLGELVTQRLMPVGWDIDPRDWSRPGTPTIERAMLAAGRHDIILCHDGGGDRSQTYAALRTVIPALLERGQTFVTL